jgi:hypothetical protein
MIHHTVISVLDTRVEPKNLGPRTPKNHRIVTTVLGEEAEADNLGLHHHDTIIAQGTEGKVDDPDLRDIHTTTKMTKLRWGHHASPKGFAEHRYPKDSSYPHNQQKYDESQETQSWLSDYLQAVKILGGSKETTFQSLQL